MFFVKLFQFEMGFEISILLIGVPLLVLLFVLTGPFCFDDSGRPKGDDQMSEEGIRKQD